MKLKFTLLVCAVAVSLPCANYARAGVVSMAWTPVGNPGNAADPTTGNGAVSDSYNIGTYDVTANQYVAFLNANDPTGADPLALYNAYMSDPNYGGVSYTSGAANGSKYSVVSGEANYPINCVTWYDAIRFANWMDNGEPVYTSEPTSTANATENGSYTLDGFTPVPNNFRSIARNAGAAIFLPSADEWYKAAYYDPATSSYYLYPTSSNSAPNASAPTSTPNSANYNNAVGNLTAVGVYSGTTSPYGAYDMGGDVMDWDDSPSSYSDPSPELHGGGFDGYAISLQSSNQNLGSPTDETFDIGFRVASAAGVPEPSSIALAVLGCAGALCLQMSRRIATAGAH